LAYLTFISLKGFTVKFKQGLILPNDKNATLMMFAFFYMGLALAL